MLHIQIIIAVLISFSNFFHPPVKHVVVPAPLADDEEYIDWHADRRLNWTDFEGPVNRSTDAAALTSTFLGFQYKVKNNVFTYNIQCRFSKKKSWGLVKNDWILNHEQGHFDISELYARYLHEAIINHRLNLKTLKTDLNDIYAEQMKKKEAFQNLYDTETDFSRNKQKQLEWSKKIADLLYEMEEFSDYNHPEPIR